MSTRFLSLILSGFVSCVLIAVGSRADERAGTSGPAADPMSGKEAGQVREDNDLKMKLVWCPRGFVRMEEITEVVEVPFDDGTRRTQSIEKTAEVKAFLTRGYWIGKYEVTQGEWEQVMGTEPWKGQAFTNEGKDIPAEFVSWNDAIEFTRKLTERERMAGRLPENWKYTLPTEAQWERACRAGSVSRFGFGDDDLTLREHAWFRENADLAGEKFAHRVGQKKQNAWGLHDMHGNVWEWCRDRGGGEPRLGLDPEAKEGRDDLRTIRGGCWYEYAANCRSACRRSDEPDAHKLGAGFRVALSR